MADRREAGLVSAEPPPPSGWLPRVRKLADTPAMRRAVRLFHEERKWIDDRHIEICRVPSLTFREHERAEFLQELFADLGVVSNVDEAGNLIAPLVYDDSLPFVAVSAHLDTTIGPRRPGDVYFEPDGSLKGPGVTDNGAGLAALVALARALRDGPLADPPTRNLLLVANVAEEGEGNLLGMKHLVGRSDWAPRISEYLILDGASTAHITVEALGSRRFEIVLEGKGGHSWNDYGRANPVHAMARAVALLADIELPRAPRATLTVAMMEGGSGVNSIASSARAKVDIRSRSAAGIDLVVQSMEEAVRLAAERENRRSVDRLSGYRIREIGNRPAAARSKENPLAECLLAVDSHLGIRSRLDCASTDANVPLAAGLPAAAIGAGGRGGDAHMLTEWYHPEGRALGLHRILLTLAALQQT